MNDDDRPPTEPLDESTPPPTALDLDRTQDLTATWPDGVATRYSLEELRVNCPCAECRGLRERGLPVWPKPASPLPLRAEDAELVGAWGITFTWNDGHTTGIFSWALLRQWRPFDAGADR
jgi:DUF971 family protein